MATLTLDLIRKKAEHHSDLLSSLEELSLHQMNLSSLTPLLASCCPNLRILYLHNNLLSSPSVFKHIARLHSLQYLNLTLNNVTSLPPLTAALSSLNKLDLTLNHISLSALPSSLSSLTANDRLRELYLTGNPCTSWQWCRLYVIARLPALHTLDGVEVRRGERLEADWKMPEMQQDLDAAVAKEQAETAREEKEREERKTADEWKEEEKQQSSGHKFTPELRLRMYEEQQAAEAARVAEAAAAAPPPAPNLYASAVKSLSTLLDPAQYTSSLPSQRNTGRYEFSLTSPASSPQLLVLSLSLPRHLDTSLLTVDVHPLWLQVAVKGKLLVLHCEEEVEASSAVVQRVQSDGRLIVKMKKLRSLKQQTAAAAADGAAEEQTVTEFTSKKGRDREAKVEEKRWARKQQQETAPAAGSGSSQQVEGIREVCVTRSLTLEAKLQQEREKAKGASGNLSAGQDSRGMIGDDDDDVPPLI